MGPLDSDPFPVGKSSVGKSSVGHMASPQGDLGAADPKLRQGLTGVLDEQLPELLAEQRLLLVLHGLPPTPDSGRSTAMGLVTMVNAEGQRGMLAFTGLDALQAWADRAEHPAARPYPQTGAQCARMALDHGCPALVIDVMGPHRRVITADPLERLADFGPSNASVHH